jgi:hypothetical protein
VKVKGKDDAVKVNGKDDAVKVNGESFLWFKTQGHCF